MMGFAFEGPAEKLHPDGFFTSFKWAIQTSIIKIFDRLT